MNSLQIMLPNAPATDRLGEGLANLLARWHDDETIQLHHRPWVIYLQGELGAGKSALVRATLRALGVAGTIRSPTYTLVENYQLQLTGSTTVPVLHMDLYRLSDPEELEFLGLRDTNGFWLVEWPSKGAGELPQADMFITLEYAGEGRLATIELSNAKLVNDLAASLATNVGRNNATLK